MGALVISGLFLPRPLPVGLISCSVVSDKALGDFLFSLRRELERERERLVFFDGGVSGIANSRPTFEVSGGVVETL